MSRRISVVITDLDNTLFDWVQMWHASFRAMLDLLVRESGISEDVLISDFKTIHEKYGTSEYAFSIEELSSLKRKYPAEDLAKRFSGPIAAYRQARMANLRLYPTVSETLETFKEAGCMIVGYTESMSYYSESRARTLGLDGILDYLYSPPDHEVPATMIRKNVYQSERLRLTIHRNTPKGELKPNPKVLRHLMEEIGASIGETIYIGDSLMKDVNMAQMAGVTDVWAKYGGTQQSDAYSLLKHVTHWTEADVQHEAKLLAGEPKASYVLNQRLSEVLDQFEFVRFPKYSEKQVSLAIEVWKTTISVQQHFNDLELRIRNFAVTILAAFLGLAAYAIKENLYIAAFGRTASLAAVLLFMAIVPWFAFYFMDRYWYHNLLYGAVKHATAVEERLSRLVPEIGLTQCISKHSPLKILQWKIRSPSKISAFYLLITASMIALGLFAIYAIHPIIQSPIQNLPSPVAIIASPDRSTVMSESQMHSSGSKRTGTTNGPNADRHAN